MKYIGNTFKRCHYLKKKKKNKQEKRTLEAEEQGQTCNICLGLSFEVGEQKKKRRRGNAEFAVEN